MSPRWGFESEKFGGFNPCNLRNPLIVDLRIIWTLPMHSQPPKSPLSGGLWQLRALVNVHLFLELTIIRDSDELFLTHHVLLITFHVSRIHWGFVKN